MTKEEAVEYAKTMSYSEAVYNALQGRAVPYKKATKIKLDELSKVAELLDNQLIHCKDCEYWEKAENSLQGRCCLLQMYPTGEWFCGNGKRKENKQ